MKKLKKYSKDFRKKETLKSFVTDLLNIFGIPKLKIVCRKKKSKIPASFGVDKLGKPYMIFSRNGWNQQICRHEIMHYVQWYIDGSRIFETSHMNKGRHYRADPFEAEAEIVESLTNKDFIDYVKFRKFYNQFVN